MNLDSPNNTESKISVALVTYNHERFITQAIESVLMQETNLTLELVIGEDHSNDGTRSVVINYAQKYPKMIRPLLNDRNLGMMANFVSTLNACNGRYVALLDGDDYWTDPHKLQKQVEFLDQHPDCVICFHNVQHLQEGQESRFHCPEGQQEISTLEDLLVKNFIPAVSVMFRNGLVGDLPDWLFTVPAGDWALHILNAQHGQIGYLDEVMSAYRVHPGGVWGGQSLKVNLQDTIHFYELIKGKLDARYDSLINTQIDKQWILLEKTLIEEGLELGLECSDPAHISDIFNQWPEYLPLGSTRKARVLSQIFLNLASVSCDNGKLNLSRYYFVKSVRYDAGVLRNRRMWSLSLDIVLGETIAGWVRQTLTAMRAIRRRISLSFTFK